MRRLVVNVESQAHMPTVIVKHINFIDFEEHKSKVQPDFYNIVRDPLERVRFFFSQRGRKSFICH